MGNRAYVLETKTAKYIQLFKNTKGINDWQDESLEAEIMLKLYEEPKLQEVLRIIDLIRMEKSDDQGELKWH
ncbi:hypothetical protein [Planococcus halocryophilus]|uniref:hypothetical protein n=1 Tax=Planococcus halocryophilus TaxID=1215089 RepID=UPI001F1024B6|nr:hypothetical protein [Planococcus halocryophilus]MCH4826372.1 hypothetical protein [Planococcus halocryophilus]